MSARRALYILVHHQHISLHCHSWASKLAIRHCRTRIHTRSLASRAMASAITLSNNTTYHVEKVYRPESPELIDVISRATKFNNNVGNDEYNKEKVDNIIANGDVYTVTDKDSPKDTNGLLILLPSPFSRHLPPLVGSFSIILDEEQDELATEMFSILVDVAVKVTQKKGVGYVGVMTSLFKPCDEWRDILLEKKNFTSMLKLPSSGSYMNEDRVDSDIFYREFRGHELDGNLEEHLHADIQEHITRADHLCAHLPHPDDDVTPVPIIPALQRPVIIHKSDDITIVARSPRKQDSREIYKHIRVAANKCLGFGPTSSPFITHKLFHYERFLAMHGFVCETEAGEFIYYAGAAPTWFSRSINPRFGSICVIMNLKFQGRKLSKVFQDFGHQMFASLGYDGMINNAMVTNRPLLATAKSGSFEGLGFIPAQDIIDGKLMDHVVGMYRFSDKEMMKTPAHPSRI